MTLRFRTLVSLGVGLWMAQPWAGSLLAQPPAEPARLDVRVDPVPSNQRVAETIGEQLRHSGQLRGYRIDVAFQDGTAELSGLVASLGQRDEALRVVQGVPGVERVRDLLTVAGDVAVRPAQGFQPPPPTPMPPGVPNKMPQAPPSPAPGEGGPVVEPTPIFQAAPNAQYNPPRMPPYAWPSYAPYNNYSRVAYPTLYPYQSWPFIGPNHPFPKIPLGWRSISLQWMDGCWFYGRTATGHDWWRIRYW